ncbi:hypothetical protein TNCV_1316631 [Trichonephila clavipes]|nr:hypothetical protein TNCV_1316631 [Trichonephila clavipes]
MGRISPPVIFSCLGVSRRGEVQLLPKAFLINSTRYMTKGSACEYDRPKDFTPISCSSHIASVKDMVIYAFIQYNVPLAHETFVAENRSVSYMLEEMLWISGSF